MYVNCFPVVLGYPLLVQLFMDCEISLSNIAYNFVDMICLLCTLQLLFHTGTDVEKVVCLLHRDLHDDTSLSLVEHTSSTIIKVIGSRSKEHKLCCNTLHKKISGKIYRNVCCMMYYNLIVNFKLILSPSVLHIQ